jgi:hypothetical protein
LKSPTTTTGWPGLATSVSRRSMPRNRWGRDRVASGVTVRRLPTRRSPSLSGYRVLQSRVVPWVGELASTKAAMWLIHCLPVAGSAYSAKPENSPGRSACLRVRVDTAKLLPLKSYAPPGRSP